MKKKGPTMLRVREVADRLEMGQSSVRLWAKSGRFPGAQLVTDSIVPYWLIPETALDGFIKQKPGPKPGAKAAKSASKSKKTNKAQNN
jgi:hypothetical protein